MTIVKLPVVTLVVMVGLAMGHPTKITSQKSDNDVFTYDFPFVSRSGWNAKKAEDPQPLPKPVPYVVIHHSLMKPDGTDQEACKKIMAEIQDTHMNGRGWTDIGYNFAVCSDGSAYEGRGWNAVGAHALHFNSLSLGICVVGDWRDELPPADQLKTVQALIAAGVKLGHIKPDYKLLGHRQIRETECPGDSLFQEIQKWHNYSPYPHSVKDLLDLEEVSDKVKDVIRGISSYDP